MSLYLELLTEVGLDRFEKAWLFVMKSSRFRPDISELREAAGARLKSRSEIEQDESKEDLSKVLAIIRVHGPKLRTIPGKVLKDSDEHGIRLESHLWEREPATPCPHFPRRVERTIERIGVGDFWYGVQRLSTHPASRGTGDAEPLHPVEVRRIEEAWHEAYRESAASTSNEVAA